MKSCRKHGSTASTKCPCTCQWLCLMREFRKKHEEKCNTTKLSETSRKTHEFLTGSIYEGEWQEGLGMHGYGAYTFPNGVEYVGEFFENEFHGKGELRYQPSSGEAIIRGQWYRGKMMQRTLLFDGALEHESKDWQYCKMPDRRFSREYADGLQPSGNSFLTAYEPYANEPEGYYDTGDGFFDIKGKMVYEQNDLKKILRAPGFAEQNWIKHNCRLGKEDVPIGPHHDLYEKFCEPTMLLEPVPPPAAKFTTNIRKQSTFEQYEDLDDAPVFYDASKSGADARPPERKFKHS